MRISSSRYPPKIVVHESSEKSFSRIAIETGGNPVVHLPPFGRDIIASKVEFGKRSRQTVTAGFPPDQIVQNSQETFMKNMQFRKTLRIEVGIKRLVVVNHCQPRIDNRMDS